MDLREQYIKEKGYSNFNNTVLNEYAIWLETKLTEKEQSLKLLQTKVIINLTEIYKIANNYSEEHFIQIMNHLKIK